jgi:hypothetical protein
VNEKIQGKKERLYYAEREEEPQESQKRDRTTEKHRGMERQQRKARNSLQLQPQLPGKTGQMSKTHSQGKPGISGNRSAA